MAGQVERNRNGLVGDFDAFRPPRMTMRELIAKAAAAKAEAAKGVPPAEPVRESRELRRFDGHVLVRYRLGSDELGRDELAVSGDRTFTQPELQDCTAKFGLLGPDGAARVVLDVIVDEVPGGPELSFVFAKPDHGVPPAVMLAVLRAIDVPPSRGVGADLEVRKAFDAAWDDSAGGWVSAPPRHLVRMSYGRTCFMTSPPLEERIDVLMLPVPGHDLADPDADKAYWARSHYRFAGLEDAMRLRGEGRPRPGFSSWMPEGEPVLVKVVGSGLEAEIARLEAEAAAPDGDPEEEAGFRP